MVALEAKTLLLGQTFEAQQHIQWAYNLARKQAMYIWDAPIWPVSTPMHLALRDRWLHHGEGEAGLYALLCRLDPYFYEKAQGHFREIVLGMMLHDFGKGLIGDNQVWKTPKAQLLNSPKMLIEKHVTIGLGLLKSFETSHQTIIHPFALDVVALHHEKLNGSGGPCKLRGNAIPWHGRLAAIIDQLISRLELREYKNGYPNFDTLSHAFADIDKDRGVLYDPDILDRITPLLDQLGHLIHKETVRDHLIPEVCYTRWSTALNP